MQPKIGCLPDGTEFRPQAGKGISYRTGILPNAVVDGVVDEVNHLLDAEVLTREHADRLVAHAEMLYANNATFNKKITNNAKGRDNLHAFMRHWAAALLKAEHPREFKKLPPGFGWSC